MKKKLLLCIILFSILFASRDCFQTSTRDGLGRSIRPTKDTFALSPTGHFYIHYDTTGNAAPSLLDLDGNNIPDYIDEVGIVADSAHHVLVDIMGWREEPFDGSGGYDIYIMSYAAGVYGYNYPDIGSTSYLQIDNDYLGYSTKFNLTPLQIMQITVAHEYFHGIQWGYEKNLGNNAYFYEMTSMWFEDILIPDGNDYLDGWTDPLFENPTLAFNNTGKGYELALFGHYLSSYIDKKGREDQKNSTIMNEIWSYYSDYSSSNAFNALRYILENNYNYSFSELWIDFLSRNLYNGIYSDMNNPFYYYIDQSIANPIITSLDLVSSDVYYDASIFSDAAMILSLHTNENSFLKFSTNTEDYYVKQAIISSSGQNILLDTLDSYIGLYGKPVVDNLHLFFGKKNIETTSFELNIEYYPSDSLPPLPPQNLTINQFYHNFTLNWTRSLGPGNALYYNIYRVNNGDTIKVKTTQLLNYEDINNFSINSEYIYHLTCNNEFGESMPSEFKTLIYNAHIPDEPSDINAITFQDSIRLIWEVSNGPGDSLYYNIFKDNILYDSTIDSLYIDRNIIPSTNYTYEIAAINDEGSSALSSKVTITSWPEFESDHINKIISIYPNPIMFNEDIMIHFSLKEHIYNPIIDLINIKGQIVESKNMRELAQGYHREEIRYLNANSLASGIYFIHFKLKNEVYLIGKIVIIN